MSSPEEDRFATFASPRGRYRITRELNQGQYGRVYKAKAPNGQTVAIKLAKRLRDRTLAHEVDVLKKARRSQCTPKFYDFGEIEDGRKFIAMELLGWDLFSIQHSFRPPVFSWRTMLHIAKETLKGIRHLHDIGYVVNDFKTGNVAISASCLSTLKLFDFRLAKEFRDERERVTPIMISTPRYASLRLHSYVSGSRKDDLETWFYNMVECLMPLPWAGCNDRRDVVRGKRDFHRLEQSELLKQYPPLYLTLLKEILSTPQFEAPDYAKVTDIIQKQEEKLANPYAKLDWENEEE